MIQKSSMLRGDLRGGEAEELELESEARRGEEPELVVEHDVVRPGHAEPRHRAGLRFMRTFAR